MNGPRVARSKVWELAVGGLDGSEPKEDIVGAMLNEKLELSYAVPCRLLRSGAAEVRAWLRTL